MEDAKNNGITWLLISFTDVLVKNNEKLQALNE
jgi:hypothetical protein